MSCVLCDKMAKIKNGDFPYFVHEFKHSYWILGDHQYFKGYSQLIFKHHIRDLHELSALDQSELFLEVMKAETAIRKNLHPWKMNFSMYGNAVPHIHWHLFPRYEAEADCKKVPWTYADHFEERLTTDIDYKTLIEDFRKSL